MGFLVKQHRRDAILLRDQIFDAVARDLGIPPLAEEDPIAHFDINRDELAWNSVHFTMAVFPKVVCVCRVFESTGGANATPLDPHRYPESPDKKPR